MKTRRGEDFHRCPTGVVLALIVLATAVAGGPLGCAEHIARNLAARQQAEQQQEAEHRAWMEKGTKEWEANANAFMRQHAAEQGQVVCTTKWRRTATGFDTTGGCPDGSSIAAQLSHAAKVKKELAKETLPQFEQVGSTGEVSTSEDK